MGGRGGVAQPGHCPFSPLGLRGTRRTCPASRTRLAPRRPLAAVRCVAVHTAIWPSAWSPGRQTRLGPFPPTAPELHHSRHGGRGRAAASHVDPTSAVILEKPIRIPRFLSVKASHVLKGFLNKVHSQPPASPLGKHGGGWAFSALAGVPSPKP